MHTLVPDGNHIQVLAEGTGIRQGSIFVGLPVTAVISNNNGECTVYCTRPDGRTEVRIYRTTGQLIRTL